MTEKLMIEQKDDLLLQSSIMYALLAELHNDRFVTSDYFEKMNFSEPWFKTRLQKNGVGNKGFVMIALYSLLVLPKEVILNIDPTEYENIREFVKKHARNITSTYKSDIQNVDFIRHIRNAVAHANVALGPNDVIIFSDKNPRNSNSIEEFKCELPIDKLIDLLPKLQSIIFKYINSKYT
jgi:hypothetical protein